MNPLVSVITVTFNLVHSNREEAFLRAVDSVRKQTYPNIEHLIIDGASSDGTLKLFHTLEQDVHITVYSEPDTGIYNAMNKGLARAKGKYIIFLNSDDFWHNPEGIAQSVNILELTQADFSIAPHTFQKNNGHTAGVCTPSPASFFANMPFCHQTMLARTELLREMNGFDETFKIAADFDLVTRLLLRGAHPVYTPCNFATFCEGGISTHKDGVSEQDEERLRVFHKNYDTLIGPDNAAKLLKGEANDELLRLLSYAVHPSVAIHFRSVVHCNNAGRFLTTSGGAIRREALRCTTKITSLFNIPILQTRTSPRETQYKLFGILPLVTIHVQPVSYAAHVYKLSIFGVPFITRKYNEQSTRTILFGCITLLKKRII